MNLPPDFTSPASRANPFPLYARLRQDAPVHKVTWADGKPAWLIVRYADVASALKDPRFGKNPFRVMTAKEQKQRLPWIPGFLKPLTISMLDQDPPDHTRLRGLVHQAFTPRTVEHLRGRIERLCNELIARAKARGQMDFVADFALPVPLMVICEMLGVPEEERMRFRKWTDRMITASRPIDFITVIPVLWMLMRYMRQLVRKRSRAPGDDVLSGLIRAEDAGNRLNEDELVAMATLLLIAGHETTVNLLSTGLLALFDQPEAFDRLREEPKLVPSAVEELLRFTSVIDMGTERYTSVDVDIGGHVIPRGQRVFTVLGSANHDEQMFEDPETLRLDREPNRHVALGSGIHYCLGAPLARMEAQIAFSTLLREVPNLKLAVPREQVFFRKSMALRGLSSLPVLVPPSAPRVRAAPREQAAPAVHAAV
jgi:cytochrome P450